MSQPIEFARLFVTALLEGNVAAAQAMLSESLAASLNGASLASNIERLADDMGGISGVGEAMVVASDWPGKTANDLEMVYVPLLGDAFSEAVTVTVAERGDGHRISAIEWGRP